jgi:hypothetical protein
VATREREILERSVHAVAEQAAKADNLTDELLANSASPSDPIVVHAKMLRPELLKVKGDLERELAKLVLTCTACGQQVHWIQGVSTADAGHWGHRFPAPHGVPAVQSG